MRTQRTRSDREPEDTRLLPPDRALALAKTKALELLNFRDRTEKELRDKLLDRGFTDEAVDGAIAYVYDFHYLDDVRYAESYIRGHRTSLSTMVIKQKLMQRGLSSSDIESAYARIREEAEELAAAHEGLDESEVVEEASGELEAALTALRKKLKGPMPDDPALGQKILAYIYRKGYKPDTIREALDIIKEDY